jgi:molybdopterin molybdotransferase
MAAVFLKLKQGKDVKLLTVDTIEQAREKLWEKAKSLSLKTETISLDEVQNRILAEDLYAPSDIPSFRRATVDGYAVVAADTAGAGEAAPVFLKQAGSVSMGIPADFSIRSGETAYVPTGGMLPGGADAVVMIEFAESAGGSLAVYEAAASGTGMTEIGEDVKKGGPLLRRGVVIRPQEAGLLAAAGIINVRVFSAPKLSLISTGDELVTPDRNPGPGQIRDINTTLIKAIALKRGFQIVSSKLIADDRELLEAAIREAMRTNDVVVLSGGSSQGEKDLTAAIIDKAAKPGVFTHGLALKPGKPTILGWDEESLTVLAGLPGHPVAAMMVFEFLLGWLHDKFFGCPSPLQVPARISCNFPGSPGRTLCQPVTLRLEDGAYTAEPIFGKSGMITTLTRADGYIVIDLNKEGLKSGEPVLVHLF